MPADKKVLIITYYWPPSGGAGVQRWLKFIKYLRTFGWEPVVYTPANPERPVVDNSLEKDIPDGITVLQTPIWEPYRMYKRFVGRKKEDTINSAFLSEGRKAGLAERISVWLRGNLFIPDARRYWIRPSVRYLCEYLESHRVDAIVSTGPPHSMHMIALEVSRRFRTPWLADFRDPWTHIDYYRDLKVGKWAHRKHLRLERTVLEQAHAVVTVGKSMRDEFRSLVPERDAARFHVITNGYDEDDLPEHAGKPDKRFTITHAGSLVKTRNHEVLWKVLAGLCRDEPGFKQDLCVRLIGKVDYSVMESIDRYGLRGQVEKTEYVPHGEVLGYMQRSQLLLLLLNDAPNARGILTGKLFEYLAVRRPVLCIGAADGETAGVLSATGAGVAIGLEDEAALRKELLGSFRKYKSGSLSVDSRGVQDYSRKVLTGRLSELLNMIASGETADREEGR